MSAAAECATKPLEFAQGVREFAQAVREMDERHPGFVRMIELVVAYERTNLPDGEVVDLLGRFNDLGVEEIVAEFESRLAVAGQ